VIPAARDPDLEPAVAAVHDVQRVPPGHAGPVDPKLLVTERRERSRVVDGLALEVQLGHAAGEHGDAQDLERFRGPDPLLQPDVDPDREGREIDQLPGKPGLIILLNRI